MSTLNFYIKIFGMGVDEHGNPDYAGLKLGVEGKNQVSTDDLERLRATVIEEHPHPRDLMRAFGCEKYFERHSDEDMSYITEAEYLRDYADDEEMELEDEP